MSEPRHVLFVGHEASHTGAPMELLRFMAWLQRRGEHRFTCLLLRGGSLHGEFSALCPTANLQADSWRSTSLRRRLLRRIGLDALGQRLFVRSSMRRQVEHPDLIYCNTVEALRVFQHLPQLAGPVLCHVHELEFAFRMCMDEHGARALLDKTHRFIACSRIVADNLTDAHAVAPERIEVVHEYIPRIEADPREVAGRRSWLRELLEVGPETAVVGGSGAFGWRKGTDLFVQLARLVKQLRPTLDVHFLWLGGNLQNQHGLEFTRDIELGQLEEHVSVVPTQQNPLDYFAGLDLFALTSREDPYPLVCLESAAFGVPIVCFERAGGMPEFVEEDAGVVVPYLDVAAMAREVVGLLQDRERRLGCGNAARQKVRHRHEIDVAAPKILAAMRRTIGASSSEPRVLAGLAS